MSQLTELLALRAILKKPRDSSTGCWLSGPYQKNRATALLAAGSCHSSTGCLLPRPNPKRLCNSSPGCWLSGPYQINYVTALQAGGSGHAKIYEITQTGSSKLDFRCPWTRSLAKFALFTEIDQLYNCQSGSHTANL